METSRRGPSVPIGVQSEASGSGVRGEQGRTRTRGSNLGIAFRDGFRDARDGKRCSANANAEYRRGFEAGEYVGALGYGREADPFADGKTAVIGDPDEDPIIKTLRNWF